MKSQVEVLGVVPMYRGAIRGTGAALLMCVKMSGLGLTGAASWMTGASAGKTEREIAACELFTVAIP